MELMEGMKKHIKRFGVDGVLETALEEGCSISELAELLDACDTKDPKHPVLPRKFAKKPLTSEQRIRRWLGLDKEEGTA